MNKLLLFMALLGVGSPLVALISLIYTTIPDYETKVFSHRGEPEWEACYTTEHSMVSTGCGVNFSGSYSCSGSLKQGKSKSVKTGERLVIFDYYNVTEHMLNGTKRKRLRKYLSKIIIDCTSE